MTPSHTAQRKKEQNQSLKTQSDQDIARLVALESGEVIYYNEAFQSLSGLDNDVIGLNITDILNFKTRKGVAFNRLKSGQHNITLKNTDTELSLQCNWIDTPGQKRYLVISAEEAKPSAEFLKSISQRLDKPLQQKQAGQIFDALSQEARMVIDPALSITNVNKKFSDLLGYGLQDLQNKTLIDLVYSQDQSIIQEQFKDFNMATGAVFEARFIAAWGQAIWLRWTLQEQNGQVYAVGQDISAEKEQATVIVRHQKELTEAEAIAHMGQWRWEVGGSEVMLSPQIYRIFGITDENFIPTLDSISAMIYRRDSGTNGSGLSTGDYRTK